MYQPQNQNGEGLDNLVNLAEVNRDNNAAFNKKEIIALVSTAAAGITLTFFGIVADLPSSVRSLIFLSGIVTDMGAVFGFSYMMRNFQERNMIIAGEYNHGTEIGLGNQQQLQGHNIEEVKNIDLGDYYTEQEFVQIQTDIPNPNQVTGAQLTSLHQTARNLVVNR